MDIEIKKLKLIEDKDTYPDGANSPTVVIKYQCPCGKGQIVDENVVGFNDRVVTLECKNCLKKYNLFIDIIGFDFRLYEK